jgi:Reverse transcriptase (RNA-dependent DNA polymerase).
MHGYYMDISVALLLRLNGKLHQEVPGSILDSTVGFFYNGELFHSTVDDTIITANTEEELSDMVNRLVVTGRKYGMEINIDKSQVMRVSRRNGSLLMKVRNRELKEIDNFNYLGIVLTRDDNCIREI